MKTNEQENRTEGSFEIPERRGKGIAGPSREVSQRDQMASCTEDCAVREDELEWARRHVKDAPAQQLAEQETKLREPGIGASRESKSTNRQHALVIKEVPLYLIPAALQRGVREKGGKIYHIVIVRSHWHHYTIRILCSTKKAAEHYDQSQPADQLPDIDQSQSTHQLQATEKLQNADQSLNTDQTNTTRSLKCGDCP